MYRDICINSFKSCIIPSLLCSYIASLKYFKRSDFTVTVLQVANQNLSFAIFRPASMYIQVQIHFSNIINLEIFASWRSLNSYMWMYAHTSQHAAWWN